MSLGARPGRQTTPKGDARKTTNGGEGNGPCVCPRETSVRIAAVTSLGWVRVDAKLGVVPGMTEP